MNATKMLLLQDIATTVPGPTTLIDMGSGNCVKSRMIIDALLERQSKLQFIPVDISEGNDSHMSRVVRKPAFCICENKDADQLRGNREADQRLCFRYTDSIIPLLSKSEISSL